MAEASYAQSSFLGGEVSEWAQGHYDLPRIKIALAKALNLMLVDEGAAPRRPGTKFLGTTRNGLPGRILPFDFAEDSPYNLEFTDTALRMWNGTSLVTSNDSQIVIQISNATPAVFSLTAAVAWKTGEQVYFTFNNPAEAASGAALLNRQFTLTMLSTTTFTITDSISGIVISASMLGTSTVGAFFFDGSIGSGPISDGPISQSPNQRTVIQSLSPTVNHVAQLIMPYSVAGNDWHTLQHVQGLTSTGKPLAMMLHTGVSPQALEVIANPSPGEFATFEFGPGQFRDGPYLDPPASAIATPSALNGQIQVVVGYAAWVTTTVYGFAVPITYLGQDYISLSNNNTGNVPSTSPTLWQALPLGLSIGVSGFVSTDVGRQMRLFSAPPNFDVATTYAAGNTVTYNGSYFTSLIDTNLNNQPDISLTDWVLNPSGAVWTWGVITSVLAPNTVKVQLNGGNLLYTTPCPLFRVGAWSNTTGWPTCGCYQGGRFWFAGAIPNRVDSSESNNPFTMSPTEPDGTVDNANGISYTFNSNSADQIEWMEPQPQGILVGTKKGEYLLSSGTGQGPITPTSISESPATKYGSAPNIRPVKTGLTMCFVQRYSRRLIEYLADVFSQRFYGPDLTTYVRHLGQREFRELAYQQEPAPIVWGRMGDGSLIGTTYRRVSLFSNQEPEFNAWHQHALGSQRLVESICVGPSSDGVLDTLALVTNDPTNGVRFVENLTPLLDETDPLTSAWYLDAAVTPQAASFVTYGTPSQTYVRFAGLDYLNTRTVSVFAAALDCGDFRVDNGYVDVPLGKLDPLSGYTFDTPQFDILQPIASTFSNLSVTVTGGTTTYKIPCVIGFNFQSKGQLTRPTMPVDSGAKNGPGYAKKKRTSRYGITLSRSLGVKVGTDFDKMFPVPTTSPAGNPLPYLSAFSGIRRETLSNDFSYDSMLCWQTTRPYPATVTTIGGFIETQDG